MTNRRSVLSAAALAAAVPLASVRALAAESSACPSDPTAVNSALLDRYVAMVNANDDAARRQIFAANYVQHGGFKGAREALPDLRLTVEDRIFGGDKIVARNTWTGTHRGTLLGVAPTGRQITLRTIDIWRVEDGRLAEHWDVIDIAGLQQQLAPPAPTQK